MDDPPPDPKPTPEQMDAFVDEAKDAPTDPAARLAWWAAMRAKYPWLAVLAVLAGAAVAAACVAVAMEGRGAAVVESGSAVR